MLSQKWLDYSGKEIISSVKVSSQHIVQQNISIQKFSAVRQQITSTSGKRSKQPWPKSSYDREWYGRPKIRSDFFCVRNWMCGMSACECSLCLCQIAFYMKLSTKALHWKSAITREQTAGTEEVKCNSLYYTHREVRVKPMRKQRT